MTGDVVSTGETMVTTPATGTSAGSVVVATPTDTSSPSQFSGAAAHGAELGGRLGQALGLWGIIGALMA